MPSDMALSTPSSPCLQSDTPPNSPRMNPSSLVDATNRLEQVFEKLVHVLEKTDTADKTQAAKPEAAEVVKPDEPKARASKLEYKLVDEVWDSAVSRYKVVESSVLPEEMTDLDEYVFVVRARVEKRTLEHISFIDVKSDGLRDILRIVLQNVNWISLIEDKITVERNLLFHYVTELEACRTELTNDAHNDAKHLSLLVDYIRTIYASTTSRLERYLRNQEITYDLLWALFKPNTAIYTTILDTEKPACFRFDSGRENTNSNGITCFRVECRYLDYNGKVFGEVSTALGIQTFQGKKRIDSLEAFPLQYHRQHEEVRTYLVKCGRQFISFMGEHHVQYRGNAVYLERGEYIQVPVDSRIMVDVAYFRKVNPNYVRPCINELATPGLLNDIYIYFLDTNLEGIKTKGLDPQTMSDDDLMICSQTVYGWSFGNKQWLEFVVDDIEPIKWNPSSFDNLAIPLTKKNVITALAQAHISRTSDDTFDDFVEGKGQGLIALLHGPPGVGKTLTAEGLSEYLERPLYAISAGELGQEPKQLEDQLSRIFRLAHHWKAIVLLDEADVFVQTRSCINPHNSLVSVFLRTLEYYRGIMFLTTNRAKDFDDAIQSRISVALRYGSLSVDTRRTIWKRFLERAATAKGPARYTPEDLDWLAGKDVNGRQIKNIMTTSRALAVSEGKPLSRSHLEIVVALDKEFQNDYIGAGQIANSQCYT